MKNIYELLEMIRQRPGMYLGRRSLTALAGFIDGYFFAIAENNILVEEEIPPFEQFHDWVARYYKWYESTAGWKNIIVHFRKVMVPDLISVFFRANASDTRQPVNRQMPDKARSRGVRNPSLNNRLSSSWLNILPCPLPLTFIFRAFWALHQMIGMHTRDYALNHNVRKILIHKLEKS